MPILDDIVLDILTLEATTEEVKTNLESQRSNSRYSLTTAHESGITHALAFVLTVPPHFEHLKRSRWPQSSESNRCFGYDEKRD